MENLTELRSTLGDAMDILRDAMHGDSVRGEGPDVLAQRLEVVRRKLAYGYEMVTAEMEKAPQ